MNTDLVNVNVITKEKKHVVKIDCKLLKGIHLVPKRL
jgi:hypothetical protein